MKYYAKRDILEYDGTVKTVVESADVDFTINPSKMVDSMLRYGDYRTVGYPLSNDCFSIWKVPGENNPTIRVENVIDRYFQLFHGAIARYYDLIESEEVSGYRFVVYDKNDEKANCMWRDANGNLIKAVPSSSDRDNGEYL